MNRLFSLLLVLSTSICNTWAYSSEQTTDVVTNKNDDNTAVSTNDKDFTFDDIQFWVGEGSNKAAIVIQWNDDNSPNTLVWGYRWDGDAYGIDMFKAVAQADTRLVLLTQFTGSMGNTVCGVGYDDEPFTIEYDLEHAMNNPRNAFDFVEPIDNILGQTSVPLHPLEDINKAIEEGLVNGVIYHPLNAEVYGYPSYDYDSWTSSDAKHWDAGWYSGYWSYNVRDSQEDKFSYSNLGYSSRKLQDGSWDAWMYNDFAEGMSTLSNIFTAATIIPVGITDVDITANITFDDNLISFINMRNYHCCIYDITGKLIKTLTISNDKEDIHINVNKGIYIIKASNGNDNISTKYIKL